MEGLYYFLLSVAGMLGTLAGVVIGFRAGRKEDRLVLPPSASSLAIVDPDEEDAEPALEDEEAIRKDMEESRTIYSGYDLSYDEEDTTVTG